MTDNTGTSDDARATGDVDRDGDRGRIEFMAAILLGIAGVLTAYAAYFGALAGGESLQGYTEATITRGEANSFYSDYGAKVAQDTSVFLEYQVLVEQGQEDVADVVRDRLFSPELETAYVAWNELTGDDDVPTPLDTEEYVVEDFDTYEQLYEESRQKFDAGAKANEDGDKMDLASVFLAIALFFAGIAALLKTRRMSYTMLTASALLIVPGCLAIAQGKNWI